jgi:N-acetylglutamate synthase-like GNAT family acetyltransferase
MGAGLGTRLLEAASARASALGYERLTLCTYADVRWNAPYYAARGFAEFADRPAYLERILAIEARMDLERHGRRIVMARPLDIPGFDPHPAV